MTYSISGTADIGTRIIVLDESDTSVTQNAVTISSEYEITTTSGLKIVIGRSSNGEAMGYSSVVPIGNNYNILGLNGFENTANLLNATTARAICNDGTNLFAGTGPPAVWKSINGGTSWAWKSLPGSGGVTWSLLNLGNGVMLADSGTIIFRTTNYGDSWTAVTTVNYAGVYQFVSDGTNVFAVGRAGAVSLPGVYKSTNNGLNWSTCGVVLAGESDLCTSLISNGSGTLWVALSNKIYKSINTGTSWSLLYTFTTSFPVARIFEMSNGNWVAGTSGDGKLWLSTDLGVSWTLKHTCTNDNAGLKYVRCFIEHDNIIYVTVSDTYSAIYYSLNFGDTWNIIPNSHLYGWDLTVLNNTLYVGTTNAGDVYRSLSEPSIER